MKLLQTGSKNFVWKNCAQSQCPIELIYMKCMPSDYHVRVTMVWTVAREKHSMQNKIFSTLLESNFLFKNNSTKHICNDKLDSKKTHSILTFIILATTEEIFNFVEF